MRRVFAGFRNTRSPRLIALAGVVKPVDTQDLGSCAFGRGGSTPPFRTRSTRRRHLQPNKKSSVIQHSALIPWLDPAAIIEAAGPWALLVVCLIIFAETGLLIGFLLPGDTLLVLAGLLSHSSESAPNGVFGIGVWLVGLLIGLSAFVGGEVGYFIGHKAGPAIFERKESGIFSVRNVERTNAFFERFGGITVILARFVPIVRTFAPIAAGVGHMNKWRYTLYNLIGAVIWGFGLTVFGYLLGMIPGVGDLVAKYIDVILLAAVGGTALFIGFHYFLERSRAKKNPHGGDPATNEAEAHSLVLDEEVLERGRRSDGDDAPHA